jgi:hypothetical protein
VIVGFQFFPRWLRIEELVSAIATSRSRPFPRNEFSRGFGRK